MLEVPVFTEVICPPELVIGSTYRGKHGMTPGPPPLPPGAGVGVLKSF
jgi:hypothetical protein